tara:strand:+ start:812 stop:1045 length:234 start_codon:yes stop_codon:yes gene_type:complete
MKKGFFQDSNGNDSIMRLLAFIVVITGLSLVSFCSVWIVIFDLNQIALIGLLIGLVGTGLGAKVAQKVTENNDKTKN